MIAGKIVELLARMAHWRVLMVGGRARNTAVVDYLRPSRSSRPCARPRAW